MEYSSADGLCPACLLKQGLDSLADAGVPPTVPWDQDPAGGSKGAGVGGTAMVGERVGRYKLLQPIGEGGFGTVYMAEQEQPVRRRVALKIIKLGMDTKAVIARFEAERQALAMMDHPNIARVFDAGATETGRPYFVMELVNGVPVTEYCDANRLTFRERLELFVPICQAVQHAHQKGIIHRDLKPSNVMVTLHDGRPMPKVIDFGIAKATQARLTEKTMFTEHHQMIGTPQYMSPEQAEMSGLDIDTRTDVYSLGVLLYELLTGTTPLDARELRSKAYGEMQRIIREIEPPSPSARLSTMGQLLATVSAQRRIEGRQLYRVLRGELDWIIMRCLEKDRTRRYESAAALATDVLHYLADEPVSAGKPSAIYRARKFVHRYRIQVAAAAALAASLLAGISVSTVGMVRAVNAEREVRRQKDVLSQERDRVVAAETLEQQQRKAAESAAHQARLLYADSLISQGDTLTSAGDFINAYGRFAAAQKEIQDVGGSLERLDLSLLRLYRTSPPTLWSTTIPGGEVHAWAVLRDRREILLAGGDKKLHAVDLLTGQMLPGFGEAKGIKSMAAAATPDGPVVVVGGFAFTRVIDPETGAILHGADDDRAMHDCALSPDGSLCASIDQGGAIIFWETASMKKIGEGELDAPFQQVAFSHDGRTVATAGKLSLWNPKTGAMIRAIRPDDFRCSRVAFSDDDQTLFCGGYDGQIYIFDLQGGLRAVCPAYSRNLMSLVVTGKRVFASAKDGSVHVLESSAEDGTMTPRMSLVNPLARKMTVAYVADTGPKLGSGTIAAAPDDQGVIVGVDSEGAVYVWPLVYPWRGAPMTYQGGLAISRDGLLLGGSTGGRTEIRDAATGHILRIFDCRGFSNSNAFSPDDRFMFASRDDGVIHALDLGSNQCAWAVRAHNKGPWSMDVSPDGTLLASGGTDGVARVFDTRTGKLLRSLPGHGNDIRALVFAPASADRPATSPATQPSLAGKRLIVSVGSLGAIRDWDLGSTAPPRGLSMGGQVMGLSISPDGKLLAVASSNHTIPLFDLATLKQESALAPVASIQHSVGFIDLGSGRWNWIISASDDLQCWDRDSGHDELVLDPIGQDYVNNMRVSPDGTVVYAVHDGRINLAWPRQYRELLRSGSPISRAVWYAEWGLWNWTRELLERERAAGHDVPALLSARACWMCGDQQRARHAFELAVARKEVPAFYADLCLSALETPPVIQPGSPGPREPDNFPASVASAPLGKEMLSTADVQTLKSMIGKEVTAEGLVATSLWTRKGKHLYVEFAGTEEDAPPSDAVGGNSNPVGLVCEISENYREEFDKAFGGDAASAFTGARLRVHGRIQPYDGKDAALKGWPQIKLKDPTQVAIVR
jgi:WD40 repeat protein/tRNA A-37 threonylcarbamoyl transferase component Bud32